MPNFSVRDSVRRSNQGLNMFDVRNDPQLERLRRRRELGIDNVENPRRRNEREVFGRFRANHSRVPKGFIFKVIRRGGKFLFIIMFFPPIFLFQILPKWVIDKGAPYIKKFVNKILEKLQKKVDRAIQQVEKHVIQRINRFINPILQKITQAIKMGQKAAKAVGNKVMAPIRVVIKIGNATINFTAEIASKVKEALKPIQQGIQKIREIIQMIKTLPQQLNQIVKEQKEKVTKLIKTSWNKVTITMQPIIRFISAPALFISKLVDKTVGKIENFTQKVTNKIKETVMTPFNFVQKKGNELGEKIVEKARIVAQPIVKIASKAKEKIENILNKGVEFLKSLIPERKEKLESWEFPKKTDEGTKTSKVEQFFAGLEASQFIPQPVISLMAIPFAFFGKMEKGVTLISRLTKRLKEKIARGLQKMGSYIGQGMHWMVKKAKKGVKVAGKLLKLVFNVMFDLFKRFLRMLGKVWKFIKLFFKFWRQIFREFLTELMHWFQEE